MTDPMPLNNQVKFWELLEKNGFKQSKFNYTGLNELMQMVTVLWFFLFEVADFLNHFVFQMKENLFIYDLTIW